MIVRLQGGPLTTPVPWAEGAEPATAATWGGPSPNTGTVDAGTKPSWWEVCCVCGYSSRFFAVQ
ncbi:hypothetical protein GCM10010345_61030 [Streptomyces canarius]|uniref:Uncharacterized protein n=1 Tax=Streptomyces canarius TaxID=285453 RepID=A0ABQ3CX89_9ACTN|nr:hypothetical protein GCM10010345_61030 [Streptomyces canarius]